VVVSIVAVVVIDIVVRTIVAVVAWALSFLGPLAATSLGAGLVLATMHLAVGAVVVGGLRLARVA